MQESSPSSSGESYVLLCDKPAGVTSHDVVAEVRHELGARAGRRRRGPKVGHAGTLDPFATGLLVVLVGKATRLQRFLMALPKTYQATARLGWRSTTGDVDGELVETGVVPEELELPEGVVRQRLPMTSAVKVDGERLYTKAHRGEQIETPVREAVVHRAELVEIERDPAGFSVRSTYQIVCGSGTYVRTLIETLDDAYCESLRRLAVGSLRVPDSGRQRMEASEALADLPQIELTDREAEAAGNGVGLDDIADRLIDRPVGFESGQSASNGDETGGQAVRLTHRGALLAVARLEGRQVHPDVVLV